MFAMHNPVRWIDPTGLFVIPPGSPFFPGGSIVGPGSILRPPSGIGAPGNPGFAGAFTPPLGAVVGSTTSGSAGAGTSSTVTSGTPPATVAIMCPSKALEAAKKLLPHIQSGGKWLWGHTKQAGSWISNQASRGANWVGGVFSRGGQTAVNPIHTFAKRIMDGTIGKGFQTFNQAKAYLGAASPGHHWHHIVEQSQIIKSNFDRLIIHNTLNLVHLPIDVHRKVTGFYGSIPNPLLHVDTGGLKFRDWLTGQSFEIQYEWGLKVIQMFGGGN